MTDKDGATNLGANQDLTAANSNDSTETEIPQWAIELQKNVGELTGHVRTLQSGKDKGITNIQKQLDNQSDVFAQALEYGQKYSDPAEAERNWFIDQQIAQAKSGQGTAPGSAGAQQNQTLAGASSDAEIVDPELLKTYGVDPTSAEYLDQVSKGKVGFEAALAIVTARNTQTIEGAATGASGGSGTAGAGETAQQVLRDQYNQALDEAQKVSGGVLQPLQLYNIQEEYVKKGLEGLF